MKTLLQQTARLLPMIAITTIGLTNQALATGNASVSLSLTNTPSPVLRYHNFTVDGFLKGSTKHGYQPIVGATLVFESYDANGSRQKDRTATTNDKGYFAFTYQYGKKDSYRYKYYVRYYGSSVYRSAYSGPHTINVNG